MADLQVCCAAMILRACRGALGLKPATSLGGLAAVLLSSCKCPVPAAPEAVLRRLKMPQPSGAPLLY